MIIHRHHYLFTSLKYIAILIMSEEAINAPQQQSYLETVIDCITERNTSRVQIASNDSDLNHLYGKADSMILELDKGINICKKYNEAKINRKYEIVINDLQAEIAKLRHNLTLEQQSRSPSKKHVSDLLEKMVAFKLQNQSLTKQNHQLKSRLKLLEQELRDRMSALNQLQLQHAKSAADKLPSIHQSPLAESVREYLREKEHLRKVVKGQQSSLEKLLIQLRPKLFSYTIGNLLDEIEKMSDGSNRNRLQHDAQKWRIRSSIAQKFSDCLDQPQSILKPAVRSEDGLWQKLSAKHKQQRKFSHIGSNRSLNNIFN